MKKITYNFSAGPAQLPFEVMQEIKQDLLNFADTSCSIMEISHRSPEFMSIANMLEQKMRSLMAVPENYKILILQGGASLQFSMVPNNLLVNSYDKANYAITGHWSYKAYIEAKRFNNINICTDNTANGHTDISNFNNWQIDSKALYLHYTPNETIAGVHFDYIPKVNMPLVADMSSMILSEEVDISKFGIIYACSQKNLGPSGLTFVIIREELLKNNTTLPTLYDYSTYSSFNSMYNTPTTFSWFCTLKVLNWLEKKGGVAGIAKLNEIKANKLYKAIDDSDFYYNLVKNCYRSLMNVLFFIYGEKKSQNKKLQDLFVLEARKRGLLGLKGHILSGGIRASIYNSMPVEGVEKLIEFMQFFEKKYG